MGDVDDKRVALAPSTNYERRLLEEAFDRCDALGTHLEKKKLRDGRLRRRVLFFTAACLPLT